MDETSPGWDAIDGALARIYGDTEPYHWGTIIKWALGGPDPLDGISAYRREDPVPHWHYVSYGMTELYEKQSDNPDESGWGFEFTFRLARDPAAPADAEPPVWPANFLQNLGRYVFQSGNWFEAGHHIDLNGPIATSRSDTVIRAAAFVRDPELGAISTPHGRVEFLQVVGLAYDEYEAARSWNTESLLETLSPRMPLFVTDIDRASLLTVPSVAEAVRQGAARDGSSQGALFVDVVGWTREADAVTIRLGALPAPSIAEALRRRLPYGRDLIVQGTEARLWFRPGDAYSAVEIDDEALAITVPESGLETVLDDLAAALPAEAGRRAVPSLPGLVIDIERSVIRDSRSGEPTGRVVG
ncbi:MAG: suppressor of fused domain protein [Microbispora sp.]|nr:suppressor of fused domain protein [Microbispora sp.]